MKNPTLKEFDKVWANLINWYREKRYLPGYKLGYGHEYIASILMGYPSYDWVARYNENNYGFTSEDYYRLIIALSGPNAWAIHQMLLIKRGLHEQKPNTRSPAKTEPS
jgi:hypothetical protein